MIFVRNGISKKIRIKHPNNSNLTSTQSDLKNYIESYPYEFYNMIDKKKFEVCMAIAYLFQNHHMMGNNLHWYYNPHSNLFEPIFREVHPVKTSDLLKNKCSIGSMTKFFKKSKDPIFIRYLQNEYEKNNIFESYFASLVNDVSRKYVAHLGSQEYKDYHSILNNESLINDWVSMQGLRAVENFFSQYSHYHNLTSNEVARIELDTTVFRGVINIDKTIIFDDYEFLIIEENSKINLKNNANLIIKSGIHIRGTELNPVKIFNSDSSSSSLLVLNAKTNSLVSNTHFYNLSSPPKVFGITQVP